MKLLDCLCHFLVRLKPNKQSNRFNGIVWNCFVWRERKKLKFIEWTAEHTLRAGCWKSILCFEWCLSRFPSHYSMAAIVYFSFVSSSVNVFPYTAANGKKPTTAHENSIIIRKQNTILVVAVSRFHSRITCGDTNRLYFSLSPYHIMIYWISTRIDYHMTDS